MTDANQFQPATVTVARGAAVTWVNTGQSPHTVTDDPSKAANPNDAVLPAGAQPWDSGIIAAGGSYSLVFDVPGQYVYFCIPHESLGMVARITVTG
ncbi:MAG TPA: plastocyanin/azurin family copper-binding protein [Chloroflexota bacterium]|nr:plastocyanin/azurin family copper-binding protein [Chloroflexota bacterium]